MTAVFYDIYLFSILTLFKILELATSSYVGSVLKKVATVHKGLTFVSTPGYYGGGDVFTKYCTHQQTCTRTEKIHTNSGLLDN